MKSNTIRILVVIGAITIVGLASVQFYLLKTALDNRQEVFEHSVQISLFKVVNRLNNEDLDKMPQVSPVIKKSSDYYVVDVNSDINCDILEFYLISEFERAGIYSDFEYAVYDCHSDLMVYGNYVILKDGQYRESKSTEFVKHNDLVYYFVVYFPHIKSDILGSIKIWIVFTSVFVFVLFFIIYAIWVVLEQRRFSELQRNFVNTMTHEFSTPLAASAVAIEYFKQSAIIQNNQRLKKYTELVHLQNERLNVLIDKLLHVNKSNNHGMHIKYNKINLYDLCSDVTMAFRTAKEQGQINLDFPDKNVEICADLFHSTSILHAIVDNAIKYSGKSPKVEISYKIKNNQHVLSILDNGIGIDDKYKKKVFHEFFRVPTGNVHNVKGFGLGLYYVSLLCKKMKWKISIDSETTHGTKVILQIPNRTRHCK
jgi:two-component system phosphate regulon sensor histidine kinase PhoR